MQSIVFDLSRGLILLSLSVSVIEFYKTKNEILFLFSGVKKSLFKVLLLLLPLGIFLSALNPLYLVVVLVALMLATYLFDGSYNGGSDYMNFIIVLSLLVYTFSANEYVQKICLLYIGVQSLLSYLIAGLTKLVKSDWRNGRSLQKILKESHYLIPQSIGHFLAQNTGLTLFLSWMIILTELSIFMGFYSFKMAIVMVLFFLIFHLVNIFIFGLNRFFFAWLASYPCLLYCFYN
jgi:hypothetical protein